MQLYICYYLFMKIFSSFTPEVVEILKNGGIGIIPSDTVYGIVGQLFNQAAVERIYDVKDRPLNKPVGTILINDPSQVEDYILPEDLLRAQVYWPGPVSVVLNVGNRLAYAHRGLESLPFRIPDVLALRELIKSVGPLATTSANIAGRAQSVNAQEAMSIFREAVDFYVDGGDLSGRKASKIIRFNHGEVETLRGGE